MGLFNRSVNIGEGKKYSAEKVSSDVVITMEDLQKIFKDKVKLQALFKAFDLKGDGRLESLDLALAMDDFKRFAGNDKLSHRELKRVANSLNNQEELSNPDLSAKDIKKFFKALIQLQKNKNLDASEIVERYEQNIIFEARLNEQNKKTEKSKSDFDNYVNKITTSSVEESAQDEIVEQPENIVVQEVKPDTYSYTVQNGETIKSIVKKCLLAQGITNPTKEQMDEAIEQFRMLNANAIHKTKGGYEYLMVGAKIKTLADLKDKDNAAEQNKIYEKKQEEAKLKAKYEDAKDALEQAKELKDKVDAYEQLEQNSENMGLQELQEQLAPLLPKGVTVDDVLIEVTTKMRKDACSEEDVKYALIDYIKDRKAKTQEKLDNVCNGKTIEDMQKEVDKLKSQVDEIGMSQEQIQQKRAEEEYSAKIMKNESEIAEYNKLKKDSEVIADKLFEIADTSNAVEKNNRTKDETPFEKTLYSINKDNIVEVLNAYDRKESEHKGDTSLMDTICSEYGYYNNKEKYLNHIIDTLAQAAIDAKVDEKEVQTMVQAYKDSVKKELYTDVFRRANTKDMEIYVDQLRGAIEAKRLEKDTPQISEQDAIKSFAADYKGVDEKAQKEYSEARAEERWAAKTGDWVLGLFGCTTIDEMNEKLGVNAAGVEKLVKAADSGDVEAFKATYKDLFGIEFDSKKVAAQKEAYDNLEYAKLTTEQINAYDSLISKFEKLDYSEVKNLVKSTLPKLENIEESEYDNAVEQMIIAQAQKEGKIPQNDNDKKALLLNYIKDIKSELSTDLKLVTKGRSLEQMGKDYEKITKSAYGTNDIAKDVAQFNANQKTTEAATMIAAEVAGTILLSVTPLGPIAMAKNVANLAKYGYKGAKIANALQKAEGMSRKMQMVTSMTNAAAATASVEATNNKSAEEIFKKTAMNTLFAGVGTGANITSATILSKAPNLAKSLGCSTETVQNVLTEIFSAMGTGTVMAASGQEYTLDQAGIDFVVGMLFAKIGSRMSKNTNLPSKPANTADEFVNPNAPKPVAETPVVPKNEPSDFVRTTQSSVDNSQVAQKNSVGKLNDSKMDNAVNYVSSQVKTADDAGLDELAARAGALRNRNQSRTLGHIVQDEQLARQITNETNLGNLHKLEQEIKQWDDVSRDKSGLLDKIAARRAELQKTPENITVQKTVVDQQLKARVDEVLKSSKRHMNPDAIGDVVKYIDSISDPTELARVVKLLENKSGTGKKIKRAIEAKQAELSHLSPVPPKSVESVIKPEVVETVVPKPEQQVAPKPEVESTHKVETPVSPKAVVELPATKRLDALNPHSGRLGGRARSEITAEVTAFASAAKNIDDLNTIRRKVQSKIVDSNFRKNLESILDKAQDRITQKSVSSTESVSNVNTPKTTSFVPKNDDAKTYVVKLDDLYPAKPVVNSVPTTEKTKIEVSPVQKNNVFDVEPVSTSRIKPDEVDVVLGQYNGKNGMLSVRNGEIPLVTTLDEANTIFNKMVKDKVWDFDSSFNEKDFFEANGWYFSTNQIEQGTNWKIHLYADNPIEYANVVQMTIPYLQSQKNIGFKTITGFDHLSRLSKSDTQRGKAFTVYFKNEADFLTTARELENLFDNCGLKASGVVKSEAQIGNSGFVSYRNEDGVRGVNYKPDDVVDPYLAIKKS